jgi:hypothetical protein
MQPSAMATKSYGPGIAAWGRRPARVVWSVAAVCRDVRSGGEGFRAAVLGSSGQRSIEAAHSVEMVTAQWRVRLATRPGSVSCPLAVRITI